MLNITNYQGNDSINEYYCLPKSMSKNIHGSFIHNSPKLKVTEMPSHSSE